MSTSDFVDLTEEDYFVQVCHFFIKNILFDHMDKLYKVHCRIVIEFLFFFRLLHNLSVCALFFIFSLTLGTFFNNSFLILCNNSDQLSN